MSYQYPDLNERQSSATAARKAMAEKFRAAVTDPTLEERRKEREAIHVARLARQAERQAAREAERKAQEAELAERTAREAAEAARLQRETEEEEARLKAEEAEKMEVLWPSRKPPATPATPPARWQRSSDAAAIEA